MEVEVLVTTRYKLWELSRLEVLQSRQKNFSVGYIMRCVLRFPFNEAISEYVPAFLVAYGQFQKFCHSYIASQKCLLTCQYSEFPCCNYGMKREKKDEENVAASNPYVNCDKTTVLQEASMLQAIERYMKQAIVDRVPAVASAALVSSLVGARKMATSLS
ncbi:hypothetical protein D918_08481 [Trichuris suis]|nr:hypothetical protein D918_08481 [Trichuris suis]